MATVIDIGSVGRTLGGALKQLSAGETATLVDADGRAVAVVVPLPGRSGRRRPAAAAAWLARWDGLRATVAAEEPRPVSALEQLSRDRR